jgi:hypothetical protein
MFNFNSVIPITVSATCLNAFNFLYSFQKLKNLVNILFIKKIIEIKLFIQRKIDKSFSINTGCSNTSQFEISSYIFVEKMLI